MSIVRRAESIIDHEDGTGFKLTEVETDWIHGNSMTECRGNEDHH